MAEKYLMQQYNLPFKKKKKVYLKSGCEGNNSVSMDTATNCDYGIRSQCGDLAIK